jgi:hypothetical protein
MTKNLDFELGILFDIGILTFRFYNYAYCNNLYSDPWHPYFCPRAGAFFNREEKRNRGGRIRVWLSAENFRHSIFEREKT